MRLTPVTRSRATPLRAALLALFWSLPGVWCAAHLVFHEFETEHHEVAAREVPGDRITAISEDQDHGHLHPDSPPALSTERTKKLDAPALLTAAVELDSKGAPSRSVESTSIERATSCAPAVSRPRAPPIS